MSKVVRRLAVAFVTAVLASGATAVTSAASTANFGRITYSNSTTPQQVQTQHYKYLVLQYSSTVGTLITQIHQASPSTKIYMYIAADVTKPGDPGGSTTCVAYSASLPESWFLHHADGTRVYNSAYGGYYRMDITNSAYTTACVDRALQKANAIGADGVFYDGVDAQEPAGLNSPTYPTLASWQNAWTAFLQKSAHDYHGAGKVMQANIGYGWQYPAVWQNWSTITGGATEESFTAGTNALPLALNQWQQELANVQYNEAHGVATLLNADVTNATNPQQASIYGLASMLLVANGSSAWDVSEGCYTTCASWFSAYTNALNLGSPTQNYYIHPDGLYSRHYANGTVYVNPTATTINDPEHGAVPAHSGYIP